MPLQDSVPAGAYAYYRLVLATWGADVAVQVTPENGDPDLYVSFHAANRQPNATAYDASSRAADGIDAVYLSWSQLAECQAAIAPDGSGGDCDIWIGVRAYPPTAAAFSVVGLVVDYEHLQRAINGFGDLSDRTRHG